VRLVRVERQDGVARLVLDSPANRNALSAQPRTELYDALLDAAADEVALYHIGAHRKRILLGC
jgi:methylglutaconyl-CoA hydratase